MSSLGKGVAGEEESSSGGGEDRDRCVLGEREWRSDQMWAVGGGTLLGVQKLMT